MKKSLFIVEQDSVDDFMSFIYPKLDAAVLRSDGKYKVEDVIERIKSGAFQLWIAKEDDDVTGLCLTEVNDYPQSRILKFLCATGIHAKDWSGFVGIIENWGRSVGCVTSQLECRPGWEKLMKPFGYKKTHILLYRSLHD